MAAAGFPLELVTSPPTHWLVQSIRPELSLSEWTLSQTVIGYPQDNHATIALLGVFC